MFESQYIISVSADDLMAGDMIFYDWTSNGEIDHITTNLSDQDERTNLRVHPDGRAEGTFGCIGITGDSSAYHERLFNHINNYLNKGNRLTLKVYY